MSYGINADCCSRDLRDTNYVVSSTRLAPPSVYVIPPPSDMLSVSISLPPYLSLTMVIDTCVYGVIQLRMASILHKTQMSDVDAYILVIVTFFFHYKLNHITFTFLQLIIFY